MKIIKDMIKKSEDTLDEIEWYAEKAIHMKSTEKNIADIYIKIAEMHVDIFKMLHDKMVYVIDEYKRQGHEPPKEMLVIWDYEHEKLMKEFSEVKFMIEDYKKS